MRVVPLSSSALTAVGASLLLAPAAHAGWTTPRSLPFYDGFSPAAASIDAQGRGAVIGNVDLRPTATQPRQAAVVTARLKNGTALGPPRADFPGLYTSDLDVDPAGASVVAGSGLYPNPGSDLISPQQIAVREALNGFGAPFGPAPEARDTSLRVARNARGDVAVGWNAVDGAVHVFRRAKNGAVTPVVAISAPGATALHLAIGTDGTIGAAWIREGLAEVRAVDPDGTPGEGMSTLGAGASDVAVAAGSGGRVLAAAAVVPAAQPTLHQLVAVDRPRKGPFAAARVVDTAPVVDSPAASVSGRERLVAWRRGNGANLSFVRAAGRRGSKPLRPVRVPRILGAKGVSNDRSVTAGVRAAVAADGGAVVAFAYHSSIQTAVRPPGHRAFDAPRAVTGLGGGSLPDGYDYTTSTGRPLAVARRGRGILTFSRLTDGAPQVVVLRRGGRDRSTRKGAKPPVLRWGRPSFDASKVPARLIIPIDCDRACRTTFRVTFVGRNSTTQTVHRVIPRKGSRKLVAPASAGLQRFLARNAGRKVRATISSYASTRYGAQVFERRIYRDLQLP